MADSNISPRKSLSQLRAEQSKLVSLISPTKIAVNGGGPFHYESDSTTKKDLPQNHSPESNLLNPIAPNFQSDSNSILEKARDISSSLKSQHPNRVLKFFGELDSSVKWQVFDKLSAAERASLILEMNPGDQAVAVEMLSTGERKIASRFLSLSKPNSISAQAHPPSAPQLSLRSNPEPHAVAAAFPRSATTSFPTQSAASSRPSQTSKPSDFAVIHELQSQREILRSLTEQYLSLSQTSSARSPPAPAKGAEGRSLMPDDAVASPPSNGSPPVAAPARLPAAPSDAEAGDIRPAAVTVATAGAAATSADPTQPPPIATSPQLLDQSAVTVPDDRDLPAMEAAPSAAAASSGPPVAASPPASPRRDSVRPGLFQSLASLFSPFSHRSPGEESPGDGTTVADVRGDASSPFAHGAANGPCAGPAPAPAPNPRPRP